MNLVRSSYTRNPKQRLCLPPLSSSSFAVRLGLSSPGKPQWLGFRPGSPLIWSSLALWKLRLLEPSLLEYKEAPLQYSRLPRKITLGEEPLYFPLETHFLDLPLIKVSVSDPLWVQSPSKTVLSWSTVAMGRQIFRGSGFDAGGRHTTVPWLGQLAEQGFVGRLLYIGRFLIALVLSLWVNQQFVVV